MPAQQLYRTYRLYGVELAARHGVDMHHALQVVAWAATQCPSRMKPSEAENFMRARIEHGILQAETRGDQRDPEVA